MKLVERCPVCGEFTAERTGDCSAHQRVYRCRCGRTFRKMREEDVGGFVLRVLPDWTEIFNECRRPLGQFQ